MERTIIRLVGAAIIAWLIKEGTSLEPASRLAVGVTVAAISLVLLIISRRRLGNSFAVMPEARRLVTTGIYGKIGHPMYLFLDLTLAGLILAFNLPVLLWAWGALVLLQNLQARREEKVLSGAFGADYERYRAQLWI